MKPNDPLIQSNSSIKPRRRPRIGIKWKLFTYFTVFAGIVLLILWLCQVVFLDDIYRFIKTAEIRNTASELADLVNDTDTLTSTAEAIAERNEVCILALRMIDRDSAVKLVSADVLRNCAIHNLAERSLFTLYDSAVKNNGQQLQHYRYDAQSKRYVAIDAGENLGDPESIIYAFIVTDRNGSDVLFLLNSVVSPVNATVKTLFYLLLAVSIFMLVTAILLAFLLARTISRPIVLISRSAKALAAGDYRVAFEGGSFREMSELADTLTYASGELSKVDSLRRELIANTSHDLRTPLTMIAGYAEIMRDLPGENTPENAQIIIDESRRLTSLVNDMLDISKLESGNQTVTPEAFSLTATLRESMERYHQFRVRDGYHIEFLADEEIHVVTDRSKFLQAFFNLVNNAITYTGQDKRVTVVQDTYHDEHGQAWVRVAVSDTGEGIPEDKLALIWDRYYKVDAAHKRAAQGTGLGLSIVNKIMTLLGGRCGVASTLGVGSTFWIEIPYSS
ncbi:MAG: HAMP domain-containing histidine kinase [Ruminococcaceae bacterium]|nr:HAMP domain-containing histidine kinase [Oscillospiraceae bacterium]